MYNYPSTRSSRIVMAALVWLITGRPSFLMAEDAVRYIEPRDADGCSAAVVVPDVALIITRQLLPVHRFEKTVPANRSMAEQIGLVLGDLSEKVVKLNVVAANEKVVTDVQKAIASRVKDRTAKPAISYVVGRLRDPNALVAFDMVEFDPLDKSVEVSHAVGQLEKNAYRSFLPRGPRVYVSGQAEKGKDIAEMTRRTMESLVATLKHMGLESRDVVQVKAFIGPITAADQAEAEIAEFFRGAVPALVFIEWTTAPSIEIEIIASGNRAKVEMDDTVEFITPPGMPASPVFSRVARMAAGPTIYISGLYGTSSGNGALETEEIFDQLGKLLEESGSDFRHLVKATYYVSTDDASAKLNELRPKYYDPKRPPAASKAPVAGTGLEGKSLTLDMIAAPRVKAK